VWTLNFTVVINEDADFGD